MVLKDEWAPFSMTRVTTQAAPRRSPLAPPIWGLESRAGDWGGVQATAWVVNSTRNLTGLTAARLPGFDGSRSSATRHLRIPAPSASSMMAWQPRASRRRLHSDRVGTAVAVEPRV
jgi:hypothetical protein